jgi:hypothetical protein
MGLLSTWCTISILQNMDGMGASQRLEVLRRHLDGHDGAQGGLQPCFTAARGPSLPRFDANVMENYLDDLASLKEEVYSVFEHKPELLPACLEGLSKGTPRSSIVLAPCLWQNAFTMREMPACAS